MMSSVRRFIAFLQCLDAEAPRPFLVARLSEHAWPKQAGTARMAGPSGPRRPGPPGPTPATTLARGWMNGRTRSDHARPQRRGPRLRNRARRRRGDADGAHLLRRDTRARRRGLSARPDNHFVKDSSSQQSGYSRRLRVAALVLPALLIAAMLALDYFVIERLFPSGLSHLVTLVIGVAGVLAFSAAIFGQLSALQARDRANTQRLRVVAEELEQKRQQLQAVNAAGLALTSELDRDAVLQRVAAEALETLAAQGAIAIENARLYEQSERMSVEQERHRIRMDLHDGVMQSLYGVCLLLEDVADRVGEEPEYAKTQLGRAVDRLNAAIADLRGYVLGLRPVQASDQPLTESLSLLAEQARSNALIDVELDVSAEAAQRLDRSRREAAYYIAADALGNIARHARARRAEVRLRAEDATVILQITDDGVGFDASAGASGHGLHNMRQRAFAVGGTLDVSSHPGRGSQIRLQLPAESRRE